MRALSTNFQKRSEILGIDTSDDHTSFKWVSLDTLKELQTHGFLDPSEQQNDSPTVETFMDFMESHPGVMAHGYTIGSGRGDHRVSIEGLHYESEVTIGLAIDVANAFHHADEFEISANGFRVWWD